LRPLAAVALTPLTGRDTEVGLLRDRWEQAQEGMGQVVLVVGEPGLGKSRLVHTIKQFVLEQSNAEMSGASAEAVAGWQNSSIVEWRCAQRFQKRAVSVSDHLGRFLGFGADESTSARFDRLARHLDDYGLGRQELVALFAKLLFLPRTSAIPPPA
jgi:energy-coupling factor transporter ATP-binding protein EcfA2